MSKKKHKTFKKSSSMGCTEAAVRKDIAEKHPTLGKGLTASKVAEQCDAETKIEELLTEPEVVEVTTLESDIKVSGGGAWG